MIWSGSCGDSHLKKMTYRKAWIIRIILNICQGRTPLQQLSNQLTLMLCFVFLCPEDIDPFNSLCNNPYYALVLASKPVLQKVSSSSFLADLEKQRL